MLVSIILPVYNGEKYLHFAIDSILKQSYYNLELIIIDDGSHDNSLAIAKMYAENDSRVHVYHKVNSGIVDSLNMALDLANGELVARMDADDIAAPDRIEKLLDCRNKTDADIVYSNIVLIDKNGVDICDGYMPCHDDVLRLLEKRNFIPHPSVMFVKKRVDEVGRYTNRMPYAEDLDLWIRMRAAGNTFVYCDELLLKYRINPSTSRKNLYNKYWFDVARLCFLNRNRNAALRYLSKVSIKEKCIILVKYILPYRFHVRNLGLGK